MGRKADRHTESKQTDGEVGLKPTATGSLSVIEPLENVKSGSLSV